MATKCSVTVQVRARPIITKREEQDKGSTCISIKGNSTTIWDPTDTSKKRTFTFDRSFNSLDSHNADHASQSTLYKEVGLPSLDQAMKGYNTTVFAYGQTGSGKTYTMMGHESMSLSTKGKTTLEDLPAETGVIPRFCIDLFGRIETQRCASVTVTHRVDSVYYEIYNDKVHDLLDSGSSRTYKVREHPKHGPYVEGLQHCEVRSYADIARLLKRGARDRHTAKTCMNDYSSRSHAVLELVLTTSRFDPQTGDLSDTSSRIALVDLAGSERQGAAKTQGERLKEGAHINKGLLSLGNVIEALAANSEGKKGRATRFVQYRDSTLTWLLREALGGNSKTIMLATVSPSSLNYEESLSTLKYADRAKKIQNAVTVNKDSKKQVIFQLREEIKMLKEEIENLRSGNAPQGTFGMHPHHDVRVWREDPYLLQVDPLPTLNDPILYWIEGDSTCYISSNDHTESTAMRHTEATPGTPLESADHTIKLPKSKGVHDFHALLVKKNEEVILIPTVGAPYDGRVVGPTPRATDDAAELLVDGLQVVGEEKLMSGSHVQIGEYQFIFVDPVNAGDCARFHQRCSKLERARAAQDRMVQVTAKKVQGMLIDSGLETSMLPSREEGLSTKGRDGEQILVRCESGPAVYVWQGDTDTGGWNRVDTMQAELATATLLDKKKAEVETGRKLHTILSGTVVMDSIPAESSLCADGPTLDEEHGPLIVRSPETGLKVVQWDTALHRWVTVSEPVAELTTRNLVQNAERRRRQQDADKYRVEIHENVTDLDGARRKISTLTEELETMKEEMRSHLITKQYREDELLKQLTDRERLLQQHKASAVSDQVMLQDKIDTLIEDYEERINKSEYIVQDLENSYASAKYEWRKNETLLEAALATKMKAHESINKLKEEVQNTMIETQQLKTETEKHKQTIIEKDNIILKVQEDLAEAEGLRREAASGEVKQVQAIIDKKDLTLLAITEERDQLDGNLRRLSKHYLSLQEELKEQQSRLVEYREQMEAEQETCREEIDKALVLQKDCEQLKTEKQELMNKLKAVLNDPKKKELELKAKQENEALKKRLETLEQERKQAEGSRNYAEQTAKGEKQRVSDLQQRVKETTRQYHLMKETCDRMNDRCKNATQQLAVQKEELAAAKVQLLQIKQAPGYMTGAEQSRRDMDLSIQLEMVREENHRLQQKLGDTRMLYERSTESGKQMIKEKLEAEESLRKTKKEHRDSQAQLAAMTSRADRLKEMSQKLQSEALKKVQRQDDDPPLSGRKTQPYGPGFNTPRKSGNGLGGRKRSVSNDKMKVPSYAKPTGAWIAKDEESGEAPPLRNTSSHKIRSRKAKKGRLPSPTPQNGGSSPPPVQPSPRGARITKSSNEILKKKDTAIKREEY